jgi:hypothetical protein
MDKVQNQPNSSFSENPTKHINTFSGHNVNFLSVKVNCICNNDFPLRGCQREISKLLAGAKLGFTRVISEVTAQNASAGSRMMKSF